MHTMLEFEADGMVIVDPAELYGMVDKGIVVLLNNKPVLQEVLDFQTGEEGFVRIIDFDEEIDGTEPEVAADGVLVEADRVVTSLKEKRLDGHVRAISAREYVIHMDENQDAMETVIEAMKAVEEATNE